jgi:4-amino-4-deoxy-L-arabinose transferase-like glycosyltransferase
MKRQYIFFSFLVLLISSIFLSLKISTITELTMDEKYYVEAARSLVALDKNTNFEHPPMGKYLIALSFKCFPNNEVLQWRFSSLIAGIATVMALFFIAILLFKTFIKHSCVFR